MNGIVYTKHFTKRRQQRGVRNTVTNALLRYGECVRSRDGCESLMFTKRSLSEIKDECSKDVFVQCERQRKAYIILSKDAAAITVAHSCRRTVH